jgi:hypothetical protein
VSPTTTAAVSLVASSLIFALVGCSTPPEDGRYIQRPPDRASFPPVASVLVHSCGTLDCHGTLYRNLRLFGSEGLRLSSTDRPLVPPCTTAAEIDQDYTSVSGLEPEMMGEVVADHGAHPERLTLVRKARGLESHKGGILMREGDDEDRCLTSWLSGSTDTDACRRALPKAACTQPR